MDITSSWIIFLDGKGLSGGMKNQEGNFIGTSIIDLKKKAIQEGQYQ